MTRYKNHIVILLLITGFVYVSQTFPFVSTVVVPQPIPEIEVEPEPPPPNPYLNPTEIECLAKNAYFEAQNQSKTAQIAVMQVVINRVEHDKFGDTICNVVQHGPTRTGSKGEPVPIRGRCQFSWYCDGKSDEPRDPELYEEIKTLAYAVASNDIVIDVTEDSLYYHSTRSYPYWRNKFEKTIVIDDHIFYR